MERRSLCVRMITGRYLVGVDDRAGLVAEVEELFGGTSGCTHDRAAGSRGHHVLQTLYGQRYDEEDAKPATARRPPPVLNTCHALASNSRCQSLAASLPARTGNERSQPPIAGRLHHFKPPPDRWWSFLKPFRLRIACQQIFHRPARALAVI